MLSHHDPTDELSEHIQEQCSYTSHEPTNTDELIQGSSKRSRQLTSLIWKEFDILYVEPDGSQRAQCKWCKRDYACGGTTGTSNLWRHLSNCTKRGQSDFEERSPIDQGIYREKMGIAIVKHNHPYRLVEQEGIRDLCVYLNSDALPISRNTIKADIEKMYKREKERVKTELNSISSRICLTADLWTSIATDGYLALTAHFVDEDWILQKRVLNFHHMPPPHGGPILAEKVIDLLRDWAVEKKVFTITLDNASYNDGMVNLLKQHLRLRNTLFCEGEFFHVRCSAHVLNLIVQDGVKVISKPVSKIRECVKYIRASESRKLKFAECIVQVSLPCNKRVHQDVPTRWNSTFVMLDSALEYKLAFHQLHVVDRNFSRFYPTEEEWLKVQKFTTLLRPFYDLTTLFSGTNYPTANLYFHGVWKIQKVITEEVNNLDIEVSEMARQMKRKFEKYWECYSLVLSFAIILDPRFKMDYVVYAFKKLYPFDYEERAKEVRDKFYLLFEEYENTFDGDLLDGSIAGCSGGDLGNDNDDFAEFESQQHANKRNKSQVDSYLDDT